MPTERPINLPGDGDPPAEEIRTFPRLSNRRSCPMCGEPLSAPVCPACGEVTARPKPKRSPAQVFFYAVVFFVFIALPWLAVLWMVRNW